MALRDDIRQMGMGGWLAYAADRAAHRLTSGRAGFHLLRYYLQPVPPGTIVPARNGDRVHVGPIARDAFSADDFRRPADAIGDRFDDGSVCIAAVNDNNELMGFMWLQSGTLRERIVRCRMHAVPDARVAWDYDFFIEPRYRLGRLFGRLWDAAAEHLRSRGIEATVSWIRIENRISEQAHARLGAQRIGWAAFVLLFGHQLMISSFRPRVGYGRPGRHIELHVDATDRLPSVAPPSKDNERSSQAGN